ncbi:MAG TPA: neocarzinostatin apoprotein domain-containing protein, partial [Acidimicrobiales bacterium]|nr:neocarzinostatin apoprotein domain-containing protein [Acidimicrobiales bacterium]
MMKRLASGVAAVALVMGGMAFFGAFSAGASGTPTITITPNTGLANLQLVTVTGSGFTPNQGFGTMAAVECIATATTSAGCDTVDYALVTSGPTGDVSFQFSVRTGTIGNGTCGTSATDATCLISVATISPPATLAYATITFASGGSTTTTIPTTTTTIPTTTTTVASSKTPSVSVSQTTGLTNGASVSITGADFTPGDSVYAVECLATATGAAGCDTA